MATLYEENMCIINTYFKICSNKCTHWFQYPAKITYFTEHWTEHKRNVCIFKKVFGWKLLIFCGLLRLFLAKSRSRLAGIWQAKLTDVGFQLFPNVRICCCVSPTYDLDRGQKLLKNDTHFNNNDDECHKWVPHFSFDANDFSCILPLFSAFHVTNILGLEMLVGEAI